MLREWLNKNRLLVTAGLMSKESNDESYRNSLFWGRRIGEHISDNKIGNPNNNGEKLGNIKQRNTKIIEIVTYFRMRVG